MLGVDAFLKKCVLNSAKNEHFEKSHFLLFLRQPVDEVINIIIRLGVKTYSIDLAHRVCIVNKQDQWKVPIFSPKTWDLVNL